MSLLETERGVCLTFKQNESVLIRGNKGQWNFYYRIFYAVISPMFFSHVGNFWRSTKPVYPVSARTLAQYPVCACLIKQRYKSCISNNATGFFITGWKSTPTADMGYDTMWPLRHRQSVNRCQRCDVNMG